MDDGAGVRIDKWLWAARIVKTRALAAEAVKGGRVHVNGQATKPSRDVRPGDRVDVTLGQVRLSLDVTATSDKRGPASEAARLYVETEESVAARERLALQRRLAAQAVPEHGGRPTKRERRRFEQHRGR